MIVSQTSPQTDSVDVSGQAPSRGGDVLIIIPSLNEQAHIESVIATLQADVRCADALIVLADGGSRDDTVAIVERIGRTDPRVRALATSRPLGISASINIAVKRFGAGKRWLVRIDAHAKYPPNYASSLLDKAMTTGAVAVVTPMVSEGSTCFQNAVAASQNSILGTGGSAHRLTRYEGWVEHGHHALISLDAFVAAGGYDETFSHNEDAELDRRITRRGGRIWLARELAIIYYPRDSVRSLTRQYFFYGRGRAMTIERHGGRRRLRQIAPLAIPPMLLLALATPVYWAACLPAMTWLAGSLLYGLTLYRPGNLCAAAAGYPAILMHSAWSLGYWKQILVGRRPGATPSPLVLE